jgi:hypothetical protein
MGPHLLSWCSNSALNDNGSLLPMYRSNVKVLHSVALVGECSRPLDCLHNRLI